jgi:hypothetical protein
VLRLQPLGDGFTEDDQAYWSIMNAAARLVAGYPDE